jgi:hypothetical protein
VSVPRLIAAAEVLATAARSSCDVDEHTDHHERRDHAMTDIGDEILAALDKGDPVAAAEEAASILRTREALAAQSEYLAAQISSLTEQRESVTSRLRELGGGPAGFRADGTPRVVVVEGVPKFDAKHAALILTPEQLTAITKAAPSAELAKSLLPPAVYEACRVVNPAHRAAVNIR